MRRIVQRPEVPAPVVHGAGPFRLALRRPGLQSRTGLSGKGGSGMRAARIVAIIAAATLGAVAGANAQTDAQADRFAIAEMTVPLPAGSWQVLAKADQTLPRANPAYPADPVHGAVLAKVSGS